jgi:hypothetical protein
LATSGQSFKIRVKAVINGNNSYVPSSEFNLTNEYPENPFEFEYIIQDNTSSIQVQVMLGNEQGSYFLDDFETSIESTEPLSNEEIIVKNKKTIYPNPSSGSIRILGIYEEKSYKIYNLMGAEVIKGSINFNENIEIRNLTEGLYFLKLENGNTLKFIKK